MVGLGDRVRDRITGFQGIVIGITEWLYQCRRPIVQAEVLDKDGQMIKGESFDEDQLEVIQVGVLKPRPVADAPQTGGPRDTPTPRR